MVQKESLVYICDNSGAKIAKCISVLQKKKVAKIGDLLLISLLKVKIKKKKLVNNKIYLAILLRLSKIKEKHTGIIKYSDKSEVCLLSPQKKILSTRIFGSIPKELKKKKILNYSL